MILTVRDRRESDTSYGQPSFFLKHRSERTSRFLHLQVYNAENARTDFCKQYLGNIYENKRNDADFESEHKKRSRKSDVHTFYKNAPANDMKIGVLCWMYWGASLMWLVDAVFEYIELHADYFSPAPADMLNDAFLGLAVVALGLVVWVVRLLILDSKGVVKKSLKNEAIDIKSDSKVKTE